MKLMSRKIRLFSISNIAVSFMLTSFMGINYSNIYETESLANPDTVVAEADAEPVSQNGDEGNTKEVVVEQKVKPTKINNVVTKKRVANNVTYAPARYSEVTGNAVVEYAKRYLGLRYVSGGYSLTYGTDCSGFTKLIYQEFGVTLSRSVVAQSGSGTYIRKADLQKGDLVFYGNGNGRVSHVGIYIGNGQVIHESNHRDGVKISSVNMMQYITARRVINSTSIKIVEQKLEEQNKKKKI